MHFGENHMFRNSGKHLSLHLMNFYSSQLSGCKHQELLAGKGKAGCYLELGQPWGYVVVYRGFFPVLVARALFTPGAVPGRAGPARRCREAAMPPCPALPCANPPARRGDLCPFVSCDTQPVFVLKFIHDGYVSLPIAYAGSPAERADKLFSAAGPGWGRRARGWRGPSAPGPSRTGRSLPLPREYARGWLSGLSDPF